MKIIKFIYSALRVFCLNKGKRLDAVVFITKQELCADNSFFMRHIREVYADVGGCECCFYVRFAAHMALLGFVASILILSILIFVTQNFTGAL